MRRFAIVVAGLVLVVGAGTLAVWRSQSPQVETKQVSPAPSTQADEERARLQEEEAEKLRGQIYKESRESDLDDAREAVTLFRSPSRLAAEANDKQSTESRMRIRLAPLIELCDRVETILRLQFVFARLQQPNDDRLQITWEEVGVSREGLWKEFAAESKTAAGNLLAVYKRPHADREAVGCGQGEGSWQFDDPGAVMERLLRLLKNAELSPADLRTTAAAMQAALVADYRAYISFQRGQVVHNQTIAADVGARIASAARDAHGVWSIPLEELGLTTEEKQLLQ